MVDQAQPTDQASTGVCPWCSAALPANAETCPSCGAILTSPVEPDVPGVTAVDAKVARGERPPRPRNRLLSWISGEYPEQDAKQADSAAIAPPDADVQREILRLEIEAEVANLQAEADAMVSDAVAEGRVPDLPDELRQFATMDVAPATPEEIEALERGAAVGEGGTPAAPAGAAAAGAAPPDAAPAAAPTDTEPPPA
jgi:hypothetical protein